jgi:hypothetical protein
MGKTDKTTTISSAQVSYTPVATALPTEQMAIPAAQAVHYQDDGKLLDMNRAVRTVSTDYADIPETHGLMWQDDFFDDDDDLVAAFDFDYENMETFYSNVSWCWLGLSILYTPVFTACMFGLAPCYLKRNVQWSVQAQHVAITRDGIRFVRDKRPTCWGMPCTDAGKSSKTVPFDKITDCDIEEPAGNTCVVIRNVLTTVNIDTASSGQGRSELKISGLKDPQKFKQLVWAMKRRYKPSGPTTFEMVNRGGAPPGEDVAVLLREIRDELRQNNNLLLTMRGAEPSAPIEEDLPAIA